MKYYDLDSLIHHYELSIKWFTDHKEDIRINNITIERHAATLKYLKELKALREKIDNSEVEE